MFISERYRYCSLLLSMVLILAMPLTAAAQNGLPPNADNFDLDGLIEPSEVVELSSQAPGIIDEILVERGDAVAKGDLIVRLKAGVEEAAVDLARARVDFSERKAGRSEELYRKELISVHDKDELQTDVQISRLQLREAKEKLKLRTINSPIGGVVVERFRAPGEYVGEEKAILTIARINPLHVEVVVPAEWWGTIKKGMRAEIRPADPIGGVYRAKVTIVDPVVDAASGTFGVRLSLSNNDYRLPAGLECRVYFPLRPGGKR